MPVSNKFSSVKTGFACLFFIFLLFITSPLQAQTYYFDTYSAIDGASSKIYCIFQDSDNNIWLGTPGGVSRFDGNTFENFTSANGLATQAVRCIFQDADKTLWFGHNGGGISIYKDNKFSQYYVSDKSVKGNITSIFEDFSGKIWITTQASGAFLITNPFDEEKNEIRQYIGKDNLSDRIFNYCLSRDSTLYFIIDVGIRKYIPETDSFAVFKPKGLAYYFNTITMFEDSKQNLWFGTYNGGLNKYDQKLDTTIVYDIDDGLPSNWISAITEDNKGNLWIGTWGGGIAKLNETGFTVFNKSNGLEAEQIFSLLEDVEGNILIGSSNKGLSIFKGEIFVHFGAQSGLLNTEVNAIINDAEGNYWIGTNGGVYIFDSEMKSLLQSFNEDTFEHKKTKGYVPNRIRFLRKDKDSNIWIGTQELRVMVYDVERNRFFSALDVNKYFAGSDFQVSAMEIDKSNNLWSGTYDGLIYYNIETGKSKRYSNADGLIGNNITTIYADNEDNVWVGAYVKNGISKINPDKTITNYKLGANISPTCMVKDKQGILWIGTQGQGIYLFEADTVIGHIGQEEGLVSNLINTLTLDKNNNVYIGTNKGINVYNRIDERIISYGAKNGFVGVENNPSAAYYDSNGNLWFGTNKGLNKFNPDNLKSSLMQPHVYFTGFSVNQEPRDLQPDLKLKFRENYINFSYKSICLTNPEAVRYKIMLEGLDADWQDMTQQTSITYQSLPPNKYSFKVIARNSSGEWNITPIEYSFRILPPFYVRWYFISTALLILTAGFWVFIKIRERNLIREKRILEEKVKRRTADLSVANAELATKNKDITDSIKYAQRIQMAILPLKIPFSNTFVLFKPKDIVSGDFYWLTKRNGKELIAAVDCTGHGVPGAFISFVGYSSLNRVVKEKGITQPSTVLDKMNEAVVSALNLKNKEAIRDGMDLALISYDIKTNILEYAGAYNPLYVVRNNELMEFKADRFPIGKSPEAEKVFTNHEVQLQAGDMIYIFSDGYADQFGGPEGKKFKTGQFKKLLVRIANHSVEEQHRILSETIENWQGEMEQIDDILIIGRKF